MAPRNSQPDVSIVIPTYARPDCLHACLSKIGSLAFPASRFEVIVVNDGGPGELEPIVAEFRDSLDLQLVAQDNGGPAKARNLGASFARGKFLVFIDDDCTPSVPWLSALIETLEADPDCLAAGPVLNALRDNPYSTASQMISTFVSEYYANGRGNEPFFTTNNFALSAKRFAELGGFDTTIPSATAEDKEFCDRWRAMGYRMALVPSAIVYHAHDLTLGRFLRQHYRYGKGILTFRLNRRQRATSALLPEPLLFYSRLILHPARQVGNSSRWSLIALLILSQVATAAGAAVSGMERILPHRVGRVSR